MTRSTSRFIRNIAIVMTSLILLSACQTSPYGKSLPRASERTPASAAEYARAGNHTAAATIYRFLANQSTGIQRDKYLLEAAQQAVEIHDYAQAQVDLTAIIGLLDAASQVRKTLLQARIFLELDQAMRALSLLNTLDPQDSVEIARPYFALKGRALLEMGQLREGITQFILREEFLSSRAELRDNRDRLWLELKDKIGQGFNEAYNRNEPLIAGWISLAQAVATVPSTSLQKQVIIRWSRDYPNHPALEVALSSLYAADENFAGVLEEPLPPIERVGVLLPLSGSNRSSKAGEIIRQGIEAANRRRRRPLSISFHDTQLGVVNAYEEAMSYQVDALIGPLQKDNILELFGRLDETPALVLNRIDDYLGIKGILQFGLAPEDEGVLSAQFALDQGFTQAVTLTPDNEWGERVLDRFVLAFSAGGGIVVEQASYSTRDNDHTRAITALLNIDESKQRYRRVINLVGYDLDGSDIVYEKRRRQDVDFIFLAANPNSGRAIRPQLNFHQALGVPVFATSDIYENNPNRNKNKDLNGVQLPLSEWVIDPIERDEQLAYELNIADGSPANSQLLQLFSLGYDALNYLDHLTRDPDKAYNGLSGELSIDIYGAVHRNLPLATIQNGKIKKTQDKQRGNSFVFDEYFDTALDFYNPSLSDPKGTGLNLSAPKQRP